MKDINRNFSRAYLTLEAGPRYSVDGLTETRGTHIKFKSQISQQLFSSPALPAFEHLSSSELSVPVPLSPDHRIIPDPVLMILVHGSPAEISKRIDAPSCPAMASLFSWSARPIKCRQDESVHVNLVGLAILTKRHHQIAASSLSYRSKQKRTLTPSLCAVRRMPAAYPAEIRYVIPALKFRSWQPVLKFICRISSRWIKYFLNEQVNLPVLFHPGSAQSHRRVACGISPLLKDPAGNPALAVTAAGYRAVQAADELLATDLIQPFPPGYWQPALSSLVHRRRSPLRQGPGSGVGSTVRATIMAIPRILAGQLGGGA